MPVTKENLEEVFSYHTPTPEQQDSRYIRVRAAASVYAEAVLDNTPSCADQQAALRLLRESVMTANAAIALDGLV